MARNIRNSLSPPKLIGFLAMVIIVSLASGNKSGASIAAIALILIVIVSVWWFISRVLLWLRRRKRRNTASRNLESLGNELDSSTAPIAPLPTFVAPPSVRVASPQATPVWASPPVQRTVHAPGIGDVLALTPAQFEELTAILLGSIGFTAVQRTGKAGDLGADITCLDSQGRTAIVQCKRYAPGSTIGTPVVQTFIGMMTVHHRVERGLIVTTVPFTQQAIDLARQHGIALIDGPALLLLLHLTGIPPDGPTLVPAARPPAVPTLALNGIASGSVAYCTQCGMTHSPTSQFCAQCGANVGAQMT